MPWFFVAVNANYGPNGDLLTYTSRFDKQMFGAIGLITVGGLDAKFQRPDPDNQLERVFLPIVFNPVVDGKRIPRYGEALDVTKTKISRYEMQFDIGNKTITHAAVVPEVATVEATFELVPAWDPQYDTFPREQLDLGNPDLDQAKRRVWRDWVLNEAGEYTAFMQTHNKKNGNGELAVDRFDFKPIFDRVTESPVSTTWFHRRRRFGRLLTVDTDGSPLGDGQPSRRDTSHCRNQ